MCLCGPNNVGRAVQTDPTLLPYVSVISEPKERWELLVSNFAQQLLTTRNSMLWVYNWTQQLCSTQQCCVCSYGA